MGDDDELQVAVGYIQSTLRGVAGSGVGRNFWVVRSADPFNY